MSTAYNQEELAVYPLHAPGKIMTFDLQKILESKRALRGNLATRPIAEKLRMLDAPRERTLALRGSAVRSKSSSLREKPTPYCGKPK